MTKQFLSCLNFSSKCFRFHNMFWRNISCFRFLGKTYTKRCIELQCYITCQKDFLRHFALDQFQNMNWKWKNAVKQKYWIKSMAVKIPILILAFVYFANFLLLRLSYELRDTNLSYLAKGKKDTKKFLLQLALKFLINISCFNEEARRYAFHSIF